MCLLRCICLKLCGSRAELCGWCHAEWDGCCSSAASVVLADTCMSVEDEIETIHREQKVTGERSGREEESSRDKTCADQFTFHTCSLLAQPLGREILQCPQGPGWDALGCCGGLHRGVVCFVTSPAPRLG